MIIGVTAEKQLFTINFLKTSMGKMHVSSSSDVDEINEVLKNDKEKFEIS